MYVCIYIYLFFHACNMSVRPSDHLIPSGQYSTQWSSSFCGRLQSCYLLPFRYKYFPQHPQPIFFPSCDKPSFTFINPTGRIMLSCADTAVSYITPQTDPADACQPNSTQKDPSADTAVSHITTQKDPSADTALSHITTQKDPSADTAVSHIPHRRTQVFSRLYSDSPIPI